MRGHGTFLNNIVDKVLISEWHGAWNLETSLAWSKHYLELAQALSHSPWASLIDLSQWELGTPDINPVIEKVNVWSDSNYLTHEGVVCALNLQSEMAVITHQTMQNVQAATFANKNEAKNWLASNGYPC